LYQEFIGAEDAVLGDGLAGKPLGAEETLVGLLVEAQLLDLYDMKWFAALLRLTPQQDSDLGVHHQLIPVRAGAERVQDRGLTVPVNGPRFSRDDVCRARHEGGPADGSQPEEAEEPRRIGEYLCRPSSVGGAWVTSIRPEAGAPGPTPPHGANQESFDGFSANLKLGPHLVGLGWPQSPLHDGFLGFLPFGHGPDRRETHDRASI